MNQTIRTWQYSHEKQSIGFYKSYNMIPNTALITNIYNSHSETLHNITNTTHYYTHIIHYYKSVKRYMAKTIINK